MWTELLKRTSQKRNKLHLGIIPQTYQTTLTYITSVAQLSHSKTTLDHIIFSVFQPLVMMALSSQKLDSPTPEMHRTSEKLKVSSPTTFDIKKYIQIILRGLRSRLVLWVHYSFLVIHATKDLDKLNNSN